MEITSAKYIKGLEGGENTAVEVVVNGVIMNIPLDPANTDYAEILKQVADGTITIKDAE
tara:strand:+ start:1097 stop:1273 length:177 start_codon:yes stop_codon:yes gene_type:complete